MAWVKTFGFQSFSNFGVADNGLWTCTSFPGGCNVNVFEPFLIHEPYIGKTFKIGQGVAVTMLKSLHAQDNSDI
jgi:hypothetical protein